MIAHIINPAQTKSASRSNDRAATLLIVGSSRWLAEQPRRMCPRSSWLPAAGTSCAAAAVVQRSWPTHQGASGTHPLCRCRAITGFDARAGQGCETTGSPARWP